MASERELDAFREQWRREVSLRTQGAVQSTTPASSVSEPTPILQTALDYYRLAVEYEQKSMLDDALRLYQKGFRLDANVDRAYHKEQQRTKRQETAAVSSRQRDLVTDLVSLAAENSVTAPPSVVVAHYNDQPLLFAPLDDSQSVPLARLPDELIIMALCTIAAFGDFNSLERFGLVNRKARVLTLASSIWKILVFNTFVPPQVENDQRTQEIVLRYKCDYRRIFMECPRVRFDGVYISVCHYIRAGLSDNLWYNPKHLITYHRYLRFFPNGEVLALLSSDESPPAEVVQVLQPSLRIQGLSIGKWHVNGAVVLVQGLADVNGKQAKYTFSMTLVLKAKPLGRWNKLDFVEYKSVEVASGDEDALPMRHERPFHFSKVRSYGLPQA